MKVIYALMILISLSSSRDITYSRGKGKSYSDIRETDYLRGRKQTNQKTKKSDEQDDSKPDLPKVNFAAIRPTFPANSMMLNAYPIMSSYPFSTGQLQLSDRFKTHKHPVQKMNKLKSHKNNVQSSGRLKAHKHHHS